MLEQVHDVTDVRPHRVLRPVPFEAQVALEVVQRPGQGDGQRRPGGRAVRDVRLRRHDARRGRHVPTVRCPGAPVKWARRASVTSSRVTQVSLTGIKPTGAPHLGNYVGAIRPALKLTETYDEAYYFIADYHALTTERDPDRVREYTQQVAATWLACGLDPERTVFYRQSDVPETFELQWVLSCVTPKGMMNRAHAYKAAVDAARDRRARTPRSNMGLFNYPVLMAADILVMDADVVPVGADQMQHIEYTRDLVERLNAWVGDRYALKVPSAVAVAAEASVIGLDGRKMSKSYGNHIPLFADRTRSRSSSSGSRPTRPRWRSPRTSTAPIVALHDLFATPEQTADLHTRLQAGGIGWGHVKQELLEVLDAASARCGRGTATTSPIRRTSTAARRRRRTRPRARAVGAAAVRAGVGIGPA